MSYDDDDDDDDVDENGGNAGSRRLRSERKSLKLSKPDQFLLSTSSDFNEKLNNTKPLRLFSRSKATSWLSIESIPD